MNSIISRMFGIYNYVVKEKRDWTLSAFSVSMFLWISYFIMVIIFSVFTYFEVKDNSNDIYEFIPLLLVILVLTWYWIYMIYAGLRLKRAKNLKPNWMWMVKKLKVSEICKAKVSSNRGWNFNVICVKVKDWATVYYSLWYLKWKILWTSESDLKKIYSSHWFIYDEKRSQEKDLLNLFDSEISKVEYSIQNSWLIEKLVLKKNLADLIKEKWIIESWNIPQYWEVNNNKVSVWDSVDVYIDSNNPNIYRVDIDFLFDN